MKYKDEFEEKMDRNGDFYAVHGEVAKQVKTSDGQIAYLISETAAAIMFDGYGIVTIEPSTDTVYHFVFKPGKRPLVGIENNREIGWDEQINEEEIAINTKAMSYHYDETDREILDRLEWLVASEDGLIATELYNHAWRESQRGDEYPTGAIWNHYHILDGEDPTGEIIDPEPHSIYLPHEINKFHARLNTHNIYFREFANEAQGEPLPVEKLKISQWTKSYPPGKMLKAGAEAIEAFKTGLEALKEAIDELYNTIPKPEALILTETLSPTMAIGFRDSTNKVLFSTKESDYEKSEQTPDAKTIFTTITEKAPARKVKGKNKKKESKDFDLQITQIQAKKQIFDSRLTNKRREALNSPMNDSDKRLYSAIAAYILAYIAAHPDEDYSRGCSIILTFKQINTMMGFKGTPSKAQEEAIIKSLYKFDNNRIAYDAQAILDFRGVEQEEIKPWEGVFTYKRARRILDFDPIWDIKPKYSKSDVEGEKGIIITQIPLPVIVPKLTGEITSFPVEWLDNPMKVKKRKESDKIKALRYVIACRVATAHYFKECYEKGQAPNPNSNRYNVLVYDQLIQSIGADPTNKQTRSKYINYIVEILTEFKKQKWYDGTKGIREIKEEMRGRTRHSIKFYV